MNPIAEVGALFSEGTTMWRNVHLSEALFGHRDTAVLALIVMAGVTAGGLILRVVAARRLPRAQLALPALLSWARPSPIAFLRHGAFLLALAGLPFLMLALADPSLPLRKQDVSFPGRRIALMIDASASMTLPFHAAHLKGKGQNDASFFTTVAAADTFVRQRLKGRYRDLISLIEFGDEAYVVTPFTNDYDNILLSLSLIGDWTEFLKFPDQGTTIGVAIEHGVALFQAFDFLNASGNLMVIFSDGQDRQVLVDGRNISDILSGATQARIPVYFIRVGYNKGLGAIVPDQIWKPAVEATGGKFYAAADEGTILRAIAEIDRRSTGTIQVKQYTTEQPEFLPFALTAIALWTAALTLKLATPYFQKFP